MGWLIAAAIVTTILKKINDTKNENEKNFIDAEGTAIQANSDYETTMSNYNAITGKIEQTNASFDAQVADVQAQGEQQTAESVSKSYASGFDFSGTNRNQIDAIGYQVDKNIAAINTNRDIAVSDLGTEASNLLIQADAYKDQATLAQDAMDKASDFNLFDPDTWRGKDSYKLWHTPPELLGKV